MRFLMLMVVAAGMCGAGLGGCQNTDTEQAEEAKVPPSTRPYIDDVQRRDLQDHSTQYGNLIH